MTDPVPSAIVARCQAMFDEAHARGEEPVGFAMSEDLAQPGTPAELVEVAGRPVVNEVRLPPNSVYLVIDGGGLPG